MKKLIILLAFGAFMLQGCDFVRVVAGRPTSAQLEKMQEERLQKEEAMHQARMDSMKRVQKQMADSLAAKEAYLLDSLSQTKGSVMSPDKLGGLSQSKLEYKYAIVVGAFRTYENAQRKSQACIDAGYPASIVSFRGGLNAVMLCPSNNLDQTLKNLKELRSNGVCPDAWLLVNK